MVLAMALLRMQKGLQFRRGTGFSYRSKMNMEDLSKPVLGVVLQQQGTPSVLGSPSRWWIDWSTILEKQQCLGNTQNNNDFYIFELAVFPFLIRHLGVEIKEDSLFMLCVEILHWMFFLQNIYPQHGTSLKGVLSFPCFNFI